MKVRELMPKIQTYLCSYQAENRVFSALWNLAWYLIGTLHWCLFLNWGQIPFDRHDWVPSGAFFSFLRAAILSNQWPLLTDSVLMRGERYLAQPNALFSPQAYLLRFLDIGPFMLVNLWILFSIGFAGLLWLQKRYRLSPLAFAALFLLFNFNGHITAHIAVGHAEWIGYFLLPFLVGLVLRLVEQEKRLQPVPPTTKNTIYRNIRLWLSMLLGRADGWWGWSLLMALTFLGLFLQGAFHMALWSAFFLLILALARRDVSTYILRALFFSVLVSALRILPAAVEFAPGGVHFMSGFPTSSDLLAALVVLKFPIEAQGWPWKSLGWWEVDSFVGIVGLAFLLWFGIGQTGKRSEPHRVLLVPVAALTFLSIGDVYKVITQLPLPLVDSERVTSRFLIVPLVFLMALASIRFQEWLEEKQPWRAETFWILLTGLILLGQDLYQHSRAWRVERIETLFPSTPARLTSHVMYYPDPPYFTALLVGLVIMILGLGFLIFQAVRERKTLATGGRE